MFLYACHYVGLKLIISIKGRSLTFGITIKVMELYHWIKGEPCVFLI
jgi:hypothetical protein